MAAGGGGVGRKSRRSCSRGLKVVYISSPIKVAASVSNFRALVQELTGRDSDAVARFARGEFAEGGDTQSPEYEDGQLGADHSVASDLSSNSTSSALFDMSWEKSGFMSQVEESLVDLYDLGCFYQDGVGIADFDSFHSM